MVGLRLILMTPLVLLLQTLVILITMVTDLVVGARGDDDGGTDRVAVYVLFMNADGTVDSSQKISDTEGGFTETLADGDQFGSAVANVGDLDNSTFLDVTFHL